MSWTNISATTGAYGSVSATTGSYGSLSTTSDWQRFVTLGVVQQGDDVDFQYVATDGGYAVASETGPIHISDTPMEHP